MHGIGPKLEEDRFKTSKIRMLTDLLSFRTYPQYKMETRSKKEEEEEKKKKKKKE